MIVFEVFIYALYCISKYFPYFCIIFNWNENDTKMNKTISIAGKDYVLDSIDGQTLLQVWVEARAAFRFYSCNFKGTELLVLEPKS